MPTFWQFSLFQLVSTDLIRYQIDSYVKRVRLAYDIVQRFMTCSIFSNTWSYQSTWKCSHKFNLQIRIDFLFTIFIFDFFFFYLKQKITTHTHNSKIYSIKIFFHFNWNNWGHVLQLLMLWAHPKIRYNLVLFDRQAK